MMYGNRLLTLFRGIVFALGLGLMAPAVMAQDTLQIAPADSLGPLLTEADVSRAFPATCIEQFAAQSFILTQKASCTFIVKAADAPQRTLMMSLYKGHGVMVDIRHRGTNEKQRLTLMPGEGDAAFVFSAEGGMLDITCVNPGQGPKCMVRIGPQTP